MSNSLMRSRWAAIGAAVAVTLGAGGLFTASAAIGSGERTVYVPITPCRIMDTRPGIDNVGPRSTPIGSGETHTIQVRGTCTVPADAVGVTLNVTALNSTSDSFLTVYPADAATRPTASSLNWRAGQAPTPNAVTTKLAADGQLSFYNLAGTVDVIADVVGYYADHNHDDRYYTKAQVDTSLAGKADSISGTSSSVVIPPTAFIQDGDNVGVTYFVSFSGTLTAAPSGCFAAPVSLPHGATVTGVSFDALDNAPGTVWLRLFRDPQGSALSVAMSDIQTADNAVEQTLTDSTITDPVVDTASNGYSLGLCLGDATHEFYSARITYTNP